MEMASTHGLALKLAEMNRHDRIIRNELCEIISDEDRIIKAWYLACQSRFSKKSFFTLMRKTIVFVLYSSSLKEQKRKELLKSVSLYFNQFSVRNSFDIRKPLIDVIVDPWKNKHFHWEELFQKRINICDQKVQQYFNTEPEEIVCARAHFFSSSGKDDMSMILAKNSFLFHSRVAKTFKPLCRSYKTILHSNLSRKGIPSMDWYIHNLRRKKSADALFHELKQLTCDEGVLLLMRMRGLKFLPLALSTVQIYLMLELLHPSKFCCTKKLFTLWSILHKDMGTSMEDVNDEIKKLVARYAPSSSHFYLLVDALWEQFGMSYVNVYVELFIRALTTDLNNLEAAKHQGKNEEVEYLESQMSSMFYKLSTLFIDYHQRVARECMFSAFSLKPNKKILCILQSMTSSILSDETEMKGDSSFSHSNASVHECKCAIKCTGFCKSVKEHVLDHPILMKGIPNIPYSVVKDLVSILESVRCFRFQYNVFHWHKNDIDLGDYLKEYTIYRSYESDTECEEDNVPVADDNAPEETFQSQSEKMNGEMTFLQSALKRKSDSCDLKEIFPFEVVRGNLEARNEEFLNKKLKMEDQSQNISSVSNEILNTQAKVSEEYTINLGMEDAIENVIRATLDNNRQKSGLPLDKSSTVFSNVSFDRGNNESEKLPSLYKSVSENNIYPYSLTNYEKEKDLSTRTSFTSDIESSFKYNYFPPSPSVLSRALTAPQPINRGSVISPTHHSLKNSNIGQEQSTREINQNTYSLKPINDPYYNKSKDIQSDTDNSEKQLSVFQQQEAHNFVSKSSLYGQNRNVSNTVSQSSRYISNQTTMQIVRRSNVSSDFPKEQFLTSTPIHCTTSATPLNLTQPKLSAVQSSQYLSTAHHHASNASSILRTDSNYQAIDTVSNTTVKRVNESMSYHDNQLVHCDRSSVIQHTMQHVKESNSQIRLNEIEMPNQLAVSVNSDAVEQIRNVPNKDITNLPPFRVNVSDRSISSSSLAVSANLVIARKPQPQMEVPSQQLNSNISPVASDTITIPGILASPSVIVSPWEAQRKVHGDMMYKKNPQGVTASSIDKRIYKNRPPYGRPVTIKSESKIIGHKLTYDKNNNSQVFKALTMASHNNPSVHTIPSTNQSNTNASQNWVAVNKSSSSTQVVSQAVSSQPWYSEPYPKPHGSRNVSSISTENSAAIEKNTVKIFQPGINSQSFTVHSKQMNLSKNHTMVMPTVASSLSHSTNNHVSNSAAKPNVHYVTTFAAPNPSTSAVANTSVLDQGNNVHSSSHSTTNIKTYSSAARATVRNSPTISSPQISDALQLGSELTQNKNSVAYSASNIIDNSIQFSQASPRTLQNTCCSPSELNPCQNCSLPSENSLTQTSNENAPNDHPNNMIPRREKMVLESDVVSVACNSSFPNVREDKCDRYNVNQLNCHYCENPFSELELQAHILNCASRNLDLKNNLGNAIDSNMLVTENFCARSLPDVVPEQNSFFQKEPFLNNLPQATKSFMTMEDDKNLDEIDANAFSACMDLINNDKDLERIVQGIDSLDQIDNNYLPYIPPADPAEKFLSNNLCNDIQNGENPLQDSEVYGKINEVNNYNIDHGCPQLHDKELAIFDFTESVKSVQQSIFPKPQISCAETIPITTSKVSNELSFTDVLKSILTETSPNETESINHYETNCPSEITNEMCLKNEPDLNADINLGPPVGPASPVDQTNYTYGVENVVEQNMISKNADSPKPKYFYKCPICRSSYVNSNFLLKNHIPKKHPQNTEVYTPASCRVFNVHFKNFKSKCFKPGKRNSYNSAKPFNHVLNSVRQNLPGSNVSENGSSLSKGKKKRILKHPQIECKFCGKLVTTIYLRMHIRTQHPVKVENSSELNTDVSENQAIDSASQVDSVTIPSLSPLLEQDFDSSTCLSASDALKKNSSFTVTETSHNSENSDKLVEKTNVKFNFNVLEFSKDFESDSKVISGGNPSLQTECTTLENVKHENIPFEDFNPENHFENKQNFQDKSTFNDVPHAKTAECTICGKSYHHKGNLSRHMKDVHDMKLPKKKKSAIKVKNSKTEENPFETHTGFQKNTGANIESLPDGARAVSDPVSKELTKNKKIPNSSANFPLMKGHEYTPHLNSKGNLLKAVLQSNFAKEYKLSQQISKKDNVVKDKEISVIGASKILEDGSKLPDENLPSTHGSLFENVPSSNPELKSNDKILALAPFEKTSDSTAIQTAIKSQEYSFKSDSEDNNELSVSTNLSNSSLNDNSKMEESSDMKQQQVANSQNLSVQSCEISPISQIISNISKCHFGGTSNKDNKKEVFEDNSLKLLIPENKDMSANVSTSNLEEIDKLNEIHCIQNKVYNPDNDKNNIDSEHGLNCNKNGLDMCNQEIKEELFHKKLSDSTFSSDDSDIFIKKPEVTSLASLSSENKIAEKESCDLRSISQEKESSALKNNTFLEKVSCELKSENKTSISLETESCELKNIESENESCKVKNTILENESCELRNISLEKEPYELRNTSLENESSEIREVLQENESFRPENSTQNESCETGNIALKNEPCSLESSLQNSKCSEIENILPENGSHGITNSSLENNCELGISLQDEKSLDFKNTLKKNKSSEDKILLENISEIKNSLTVNEVSDLEENMLKNKLCEHENASQENDSSVEQKSYIAENIELKEELCELKNILSNQNNIMCRLCQQNLDSMEILSKHLKDFHDLPVLKKHVSERSSKKKSPLSVNAKLSPPNLKLVTNESDSESVSDFDCPQNWTKPTIDMLSQGMHKNEKLSESNLLTIPSPAKQNILDKDTDLHNLPSAIKKSSECSNKDFDVGNLSSIQSLKSPPSNLNCQLVMTPLNKFRRLSLDDTCSVTPVKLADEHISNKLCKSGKRKSKSLPNIKIVFPSVAPSQNESKVTDTKPLIMQNIYIESSLSEDASFSSINDSIENCKSSYDSSLSSSSSSQSNTIPLNEITINSNFILPNSSNKIILKSKLAGRKLIIQRFKKKKEYRKKRKSELFSRKKIRTSKIFKPIIITLKEATEVDKFLETHKQPIVKLIRLKDNEFDCLSNEKTSSISYVKRDKINMMPIVRLEKINETILRDKEQFVPNVLQQDVRKCVKSRRTVKSYRKNCMKSKNKTVSSKVSQTLNVSDESIEIVDDDSSDSVQFLKTVTKEEKLKIKPDFCTTPETKPCSVVLKREALYHM